MLDNGVSRFIRKMDAMQKASRLYPRRAGVLAVNFTKERFRQQNWIGDRTEQWPKRKFNGNGRATMTGKGSGGLRRSYRITRSDNDTVIIGSDKPYAQIHNEGGKIPITKKMRALFWAKHIAAKDKGNKKEAQYYMNLATTKKSHFTIPRRQHIGESPVLVRNIERQVAADFTKALKV